MKKINYTGSSKVIIRLCEAVNDLIDGGGATVNDGVLTIQKNGTDVQTFSANQSTNATANITVPTALSDMTDDTTHRVVTDTQISGWDGKQDDIGLSIVNGVICQTYTV